MSPDLPGFPGIPDLSKLVEAPKSEPKAASPEILTVEQLAAYWGVTPKSIKQAAWKGDIPGCVKVLGEFVFDKEVVLDTWVPPSVQSWASNLPDVPIAVGSELTIEGGKQALQDAALARLHDLHVLVSPARWAKIILKAVDQAGEGDRHARKWLGDYLMGPPVRRVEAEVDVKVSQSYSDEMRAQAIEALLNQAGRRTIIDVPSRPSTESDTSRETAT